MNGEVFDGRGASGTVVRTDVFGRGITRSRPGCVSALPQGGGGLEARGLLGAGVHGESESSVHGPRGVNDDGDGCCRHGRGHDDRGPENGFILGAGGDIVDVRSDGSGGEESESKKLHNDICFVLYYNSTNLTHFHTPKKFIPACLTNLI